MSRVVRIHEQGGPEVLKLEEHEVALPGPGEARVRIEAIGLNRSEAAFRAGQYPVKPALPTLMGYEACGVIDALGDGVSDFAVGDRVCVLPMYRLGEYGVYADMANVPARVLLPAPPGLSPIEAASIWMQYMTAMAIIEMAHAAPGDFVIIRAASSSVGLAAIQLTNLAGATPIATTRKSGKAAALKAHGAAHVIATEESDLVAEVMKITGGKGARIVFDPVAGPYVETLVLRGLAEGKLKPVIARAFRLDEIVDAHRYLESNAQVGKIVVVP
jgi:NADPH:quinone reductase-like Zn-dependent oxidoreductase